MKIAKNMKGDLPSSFSVWFDTMDLADKRFSISKQN